jgi:succinate dehydrogenase / fumarate reductase cytochrome b subunit
VISETGQYKERGLNWLLKSFTSSIGKKLLMAITGLSLCGFLIVHLAGHFLLYAGPEAYNRYSETLHSQKILLPIAEIGLLGLFASHLATAILTHRENLRARPIGYAMRQSKLPPTLLAKPASAVMFPTGVMVGLFLLLHLSDFRFELRNPAVAEMSAFDKATILLRDPITAIGYILGSLALGYHVLHGFRSAAQTLGFNHPKYNSLIKWISTAFALLVSLGFGSFPLWAIARLQSKGG